jgi:hypothetical protein
MMQRRSSGSPARDLLNNVCGVRYCRPLEPADNLAARDQRLDLRDIYTARPHLHSALPQKAHSVENIGEGITECDRCVAEAFRPVPLVLVLKSYS